MKAFQLAAVLMVIHAPAVADATLNGHEPSGQTPNADHAVGFYDSRHQRVMLVGGAGDPLHDSRDSVWSWSGERWELITENGPLGRVNAAAAYDAQRGRAVVFGGARKSVDTTWQVVGDAWEHGDTGWEPVVGVPARDHHALVQGRGGRILLFGGIPSERSAPWPGETWERNDGNWRRVSETGPPARGRTALAFDTKRQRVVLFGGVSAPAGRNGPQTFLGDTWLWDGAHWQQAAANGPPGRYAHGLVYDEGAGVVLLYSGAAAHKGAPLSDMWQWDGARWTEIRLTGATPGYRYQPVMVYDRARSKTVLYGGINGAHDTWEWDRQQWRRVSP